MASSSSGRHRNQSVAAALECALEACAVYEKQTVASDVLDLASQANRISINPIESSRVADQVVCLLSVCGPVTVPAGACGQWSTEYVKFVIYPSYPQDPPTVFMKGFGLRGQRQVRKSHPIVDANGKCHLPYLSRWQADATAGHHGMHRSLLSLYIELCEALLAAPPLMEERFPGDTMALEDASTSQISNFPDLSLDVDVELATGIDLVGKDANLLTTVARNERSTMAFNDGDYNSGFSDSHFADIVSLAREGNGRNGTKSASGSSSVSEYSIGCDNECGATYGSGSVTGGCEAIDCQVEDLMQDIGLVPSRPRKDPEAFDCEETLAMDERRIHFEVKVAKYAIAAMTAWNGRITSSILSEMTMRRALQVRKEVLVRNVRCFERAELAYATRLETFDSKTVPIEQSGASGVMTAYAHVDARAQPANRRAAQLLDLVTEDCAIEDTLYQWGRSFEHKCIAMDDWLRSTRLLCKEQYKVRATIQKIVSPERGICRIKILS